jgi:hypothetical protein
MAAGVIKELGPNDRPYYTHQDVMLLLGVSRSKAYDMINDMRKECIKEGIIARSYPNGKIPKKYFNRVCMIE